MSSSRDHAALVRTPSGYIDLQINGLNGVDFNSSMLSDEAWDLALEALANDGTHGFLPTLITDSADSLKHKLARLAVLCNQTRAGAIPLGIHLEGPFLSPITGYVGAHPPHHTALGDVDLIKGWMDASQGQIRLVTLAPECDRDGAVTRYLSDCGVLVAAGHTNASLDELKRAIDSGLSLFTHLGNACPPSLSRHDNVLNRALSLKHALRYTLIADGHHLPPWLLRTWIDFLGSDRVALISDAISAAGLPAGTHRLGDQEINVGPDGVPRSPDGTHFVGSGATLGKMADWLEPTGWYSKSDLSLLLRQNALTWLGIAMD
jgi:N-acetylglucosamine-6-phosphate deacetylase